MQESCDFEIVRFHNSRSDFLLLQRSGLKHLLDFRGRRPWSRSASSPARRIGTLRNEILPVHDRRGNICSSKVRGSRLGGNALGDIDWSSTRPIDNIRLCAVIKQVANHIRTTGLNSGMKGGETFDIRPPCAARQSHGIRQPARHPGVDVGTMRQKQIEKCRFTSAGAAGATRPPPPPRPPASTPAASRNG